MADNRELMDNIKRAKEMKKIQKIQEAMKESANNFAIRNQGERVMKTHEKLQRLFAEPFKGTIDVENNETHSAEKKRKAKDISNHSKLMNIKEEIFNLILAHIKTHYQQ